MAQNVVSRQLAQTLIKCPYKIEFENWKTNLTSPNLT